MAVEEEGVVSESGRWRRGVDAPLSLVRRAEAIVVDDGGRDVAAVSERTDRRINSVLVVDDASVDAIVLIYLVCVTSFGVGGTLHSCMHCASSSACHSF